MKNRFITVMLLLVFLVTLTVNAQATSPASTDKPALVYVDLSSPDDLTRFALTQLPMYAMLDKGLLTGANLAGQQSLNKAGLASQVLDPDIGSGSYYLAETRSSRPATDFTSYGLVLLQTSNGVLLRMDPSQVDAITQAGAELRLITLTPKPLPTTQTETVFPDVIIPDPLIQQMIDQVTDTQVYTYNRQLAGELPVWVDGGPYTITTRQTYSGTPIQKATHYVGERMAADGLDVEYHVWNSSTNPNVVGEIPGLVNPENIFIIGAHIDDVTGSPGADDNGSGSVATLLAADILSQYQWGCTLRFAFWTGEEQGLLGSAAYAQRASNLGENIVGYLNLDMIAYNTAGSQPGIDLLYRTSMPLTQALAQLYSDVITAYSINLTPQLVTSLGGGSDHSSFWDHQYTSILAIEDQSDFNPYYHSSQDTIAHTDRTFFTNFVKASIATYAHMSGCLIPSGLGRLDGHVTAFSGGAPILDATVTAADGEGHNYSTFTDATGYYSRTLITDTYTVTASAYGYLPSTINNVKVISGTVTTQDLALDTAPTYIVSGTITESGTGLPLFAEIKFDGSPVTVWSDPDSGFYQALLPVGSYTMKVSADFHHPQEREIVVDANQNQNFALESLACILLVDDDGDDPDVNSYYTAALGSLGADYDIWDTSINGDPLIKDLSGYHKLLWYTGYPYNNTFNTINETAVSSYLDAGGNFFLSSQDYLYDRGLTAFGQNYLHIQSYTSDVNQATVTGQNVFSGLGPYGLSYPFTNYSDVVNPDAQAKVAFSGNVGNAAVSFDGANFNTVFLGYPFETIPQLADRQAVMGRLLDFFGSCSTPCSPVTGADFTWTPPEPYTGEMVTFSGTASGTQPIDFQWNFDDNSIGIGITTTHTYIDSGDYTVVLTATNACGEASAEQVITISPACEPVSELGFTWTPLEPYAGEPITFTATASGTQPIDFQWNFDDNSIGTGITTTHTYTYSRDFTVVLTATNACGETITDNTITVSPVCGPVRNINFTWMPLEPYTGEPITYTASASGTQPIDFEWNFGDMFTATGAMVSHAYPEAGTYTVELTATNACGEDFVSQNITILQKLLEFFLPLLTR